jgi:hypothetical protein
MDQLFLLAYRLVAISLGIGDFDSLEKRSKDFSEGLLAGYVLYFI